MSPCFPRRGRAPVLFSCVLLLSASCAAEEEHPFGSGGLADTADSEPVAGACELGAEGLWEAPGSSALSFDTTFSEAVGTVASLEWSSDEPGRVRAFTRLSSGRELATPQAQDATSSGALQLRGLPALTEVEVRLCLEDDAGDAVFSEIAAVSTGGPPSDLPIFEALPGSAEPLPGFQLITTVTDGAAGAAGAVVIIDQDGDPVWWWSTLASTTDSTAALSLDGEWVWLMTDGGLGRVSYDGSEVETFEQTRDRGVHHHFELLPEGEVAYLGREEVEGPDGQLATSHTLEILAADGSVQTLWSYADVVDELLPYDVWSELQGQGTPQLGNINHIAYDADLRRFFVSLQTEGCVLEIGRDSGELEGWVCPLDQGDGGSFDGESPWLATHGIDLTDDGFFIFVNETDADDCAMVARVSADRGLEVVAEEWTDGGAECHHNPVLGDVQVVEDEGLIVTWSTSAQVEQLTLEGERRLLLSASFGQAFGYGVFLADLYGAP